MLEVEYEGIYASNVGEYKKTASFKFKHEVAGNHTDCLESHLKKRYVPIMIQKQKNKMPFDHLVNFRLISYKKNEKPCDLDGLDIFKMSEYQIQELARFFNLFEIPLPFTVSLDELREVAAIQYLKKVVGLEIDKDSDKEKFSFFEKDLYGKWRLNLNGEELTVSLKEKAETTEDKILKQSLSDALSGGGSDIELPSSDDLTVNV